MSTPEDSCPREHEKRTPKKYEAKFSRILHTYGKAEVTLWILKHGTEHERVWWWTMLLESETGEEIPLALDIAALGYNEANAIRVAGIRLQEKLVKAFLKLKPIYV